MTYTLSIDDNATPAIAELVRRTRDKTQLHRKVGADVRELIRNYVLANKEDRHATADRLGAPHSNFVAKAANAVQLKTANNEKAEISLDHPWFARAFGDVTIKPSKTYLTIPLIAAAYNQRAPTIQGLFPWTNPKTGKSFLASALKAPGVKSTLELWYLLLKVVHQTQDRTRLPTDDVMKRTATNSVTAFYTRLLEELSRAKAAKAGGAP